MGGGGWGVRGRGRVEGVRVDVIEELKFLGKLKKNVRGGRGLGEGGRGVGGGGDGVGGQGGCELRIEVFVKIQKNNWGGRGRRVGGGGKSRLGGESGWM